MVRYETTVQVVEFESEDAAFTGEMKITTSLVELNGGTEVTMLCEDIPAGIRPQDNEQGCREPLQQLAAPLE